MNRMWQAYFGTGLVKTAEDFGVQAEHPSHPELLDWLATEFVARGWDMKAMHRLIVTSATYRQSSRSTAAAHERDPENRLLARGPRHRLLVDAARSSPRRRRSARRKMGGPGVKPYQPPASGKKPRSARRAICKTRATLSTAAVSMCFGAASSAPPRSSTSVPAKFAA